MEKLTKFFKSEPYEPIDEHEQGLISDIKGPIQGNGHLFLARESRQVPWVIATAVFAALASIFFVRSLQLQKRASFETGYSTDLVLAKSSIQVQNIRFTGGIKFYDNGTMYRAIERQAPQYVGKPSLELEKAWEDLIGLRYIAFTEEQKTTIAIEMTKSPADGLFRAGPDIFHSLHCVNKLRKTIDGYLHKMEDEIDESLQNLFHLEHCLDFLRQLVQCSSDLTPIPLVWSKGAGTAIPDFEQVHRCRRFDGIRDWARKQNEEALRLAKTP